MTQTCTRCSRLNPPDALYCYHDGSVLGDGTRGPLRTGTQPFPSEFVFPSGRTCRSFDELLLSCHAEWDQALRLLEQGYLQNFLGGLGRTDLAQAAQEAARFPDRDRGLDQLLAKLPSEALEPAKLAVEPGVVNLGQLRIGEDRTFELRLANQGMRLLYGSVTCTDCVWLTLGDAPGAAEKLFQLTGDTTIPVHVRGQHLRAGSKPQEGQLLIESNGGTVEVLVRVEVAVRPFSEGVLAGALSPRQLAEKARTTPKESAALFEKGLVAQWYRDNGWTYPVQGPAALGMGAVQQFFEALGLTTPPKVELSEQAVVLRGDVGQELRHVLKVETQEKKPVFAHASSDQPWLEVGRAQLNGRTALIRLVVPAVPNREGQALRATVRVAANGNQRFVVPVTLEVGVQVVFDAAEACVEPEPETNGEAADFSGLEASAPPPPTPRPAVKRPRPSLKHLVPAGLLLLALGGVMLWDAFAPASISAPDRDAHVAVLFHPDLMRFGIIMPKERDPTDSKDPNKRKRLTYDERGLTNNTCIRIDDHENLFGQSPGRWARENGKSLKRVELEKNRRWMSAWDYAEGVRVTQYLEIIRGEQSRLLDTCLVRYEIENQSEVVRKVGIRVMIDTWIGANDGVPFLIPGQPGLLDTQRQFDEKDVPDFIQALENPDLENPGTVAQMGLKVQRDYADTDDAAFEPIESMLICHWPGNQARWKWEPTPLNRPAHKKDSCVALYWADRPMAPKEKREMAFTYGLGSLSGTSGGRLAMTGGGSFRPGGTFTVTAYIKDPKPDQEVALRLPQGLKLAPKEVDRKPVQPEKGKDYTQVSWRVQAERVGKYDLEAELIGVARERYAVVIKEKSFLD